MCACIKRKYFLKLCRIHNPSPLLFLMHYHSNCLGFIPTPSLCMPRCNRLLCVSSAYKITLPLPLQQGLGPNSPPIWVFLGWVTARLSLSDQQKEMPRLCSQWNIWQHTSQSTGMDTAKKITILNNSLAFTS